MKRTMLILTGATMVLRAIAVPELSGTPEELAAHLRSLPGQVVYTATVTVTFDVVEEGKK